MQLKDLVKPIEEQTDEELLARIREIRHNRETLRPARRKHEERVEKKASRARVGSMEDLIGKLSDSEREELMKKLTEQGEAG